MAPDVPAAAAAGSPGDAVEWQPDAVEELMVRCLDVPPGPARDALVEATCREHPESSAELRRRLTVLGELGIEDGSAAAFVAPSRLGDFDLGERLGEGGMAVVHAGLQRSLQREVAIKLLRPGELLFPSARERFRREVETLARLEHPGIVRVFAVGDDVGLPWFAMERLRGSTLAALVAALRRRAPESLRAADVAAVIGAEPASELADLDWIGLVLHVGIEVGRALAYAHAAGVLHRDVKPSNVMLLPSGRVVLLDFGLMAGAAPEPLTRSGARLGTLQYMSPQQLGDARLVDARDDVYSLAATLIELCALSPPFAGGDRLALERAILNGTSDVRTNLRTRNPRVPAELAIVLRKASDADRGRRYADADAFVRELLCIRDGRPITARAPGAVHRAWRWCRRHPARAVLAALVVWLFVGTPLVLWLLARDHSRVLRELNGELTTALATRDVELTRGEVLADFLRGTFGAGEIDLGAARDRTAAELFERAVARADTVADRRTRGELRSYLAEILGDLKRPSAALRVARAALADLDGLEPDEPGHARLLRARAVALTEVVDCEMFAGHFDTARDAATEVLALGVWPEGSAEQVEIAMRIAIIRLRQGDDSQLEVIRGLRAAASPAADVGAWLRAESTYVDNLVRVAMREPKRATALLAEVEAVVAALEPRLSAMGDSSPIQVGLLHAIVAHGCRATGDLDAAERHLLRARELVESEVAHDDLRLLAVLGEHAGLLLIRAELRAAFDEIVDVLSRMPADAPVEQRAQALDVALSAASDLREYARMGPWLRAVAAVEVAPATPSATATAVMRLRQAECDGAAGRFAAARTALAGIGGGEDPFARQLEYRARTGEIRLEWLADDRGRAAALARAFLARPDGEVAARELPWGPYVDLALAAALEDPAARIARIDAAFAARPGWLGHGGVWAARRLESWAVTQLQAARWEAELGRDPGPRRASVRAALAASPARFDDLLDAIDR